MYFSSTPLPSPPSLLLSEKDMVEWCMERKSEGEPADPASP